MCGGLQNPLLNELVALPIIEEAKIVQKQTLFNSHTNNLL